MKEELKDLKEKTQLVIDTLQHLDIKASYDNMNYLLGCLKTLAVIRGGLEQLENRQETRAVEEVAQNANE